MTRAPGLLAEDVETTEQRNTQWRRDILCLASSIMDQEHLMSEAYTADYVSALKPEQIAKLLTDLSNRRIKISNELLEAKRQLAAISPTAPASADVEWAVSRWRSEVANRPMQNIHRRALDTTWRQVIRHFGGDDIELCGPAHDRLMESKS